MTTSKTTLKSAKDFDVDLFMSGFTAYRPPVRLHKRGDLKEQIDLLADKIQAAQVSAIIEESLSDEGSVDELIDRHDALVAEFEADENVQEFRFRATTSVDWQKARAAVLAETPEGEKEPEAGPLFEAMYPHLWAETLIEPAGITAEHFKALRNLLGDGAIAELQTGWERVSRAGVGEDESAPFSRKPLRIPTKGKPELDSE